MAKILTTTPLGTTHGGWTRCDRRHHCGRRGAGGLYPRASPRRSPSRGAPRLSMPARACRVMSDPTATPAPPSRRRSWSRRPCHPARPRHAPPGGATPSSHDRRRRHSHAAAAAAAAVRGRPGRLAAAQSPRQRSRRRSHGVPQRLQRATGGTNERGPARTRGPPPGPRRDGGPRRARAAAGLSGRPRPPFGDARGGETVAPTRWPTAVPPRRRHAATRVVTVREPLA